MDGNLTIETDREEKAYPRAESPTDFRYTVRREVLESPDTGRYSAYGISVFRGNREIEFISDVTSDGEALEKLVRLCNEEGLDVLHIHDVVEDFLSR